LRHAVSFVKMDAAVTSSSSMTSLRNASSAPPTERQKQLMSRGLPKRKPIPGVKETIVVASGKGGVGKSTTAVNLALALANQGQKKVGLLDADVYGPSIPTMMNLAGQEAPLLDEKTQKMIPMENYGVKCMSMGFLIRKSESALVWRGPMVMGALQKLTFETLWSDDEDSDLDVLVIDTPPGTGDIHLSIAQTIQVSGALVVSTPQKVALIDARKAVSLFQSVHIPIVGLMENMSAFTCSKCGHQTRVFNSSGEEEGSAAAKLATDVGVAYLGGVPLEPEIMRNADQGTPIVVSNPDSLSTKSYLDLANQVNEFLQTTNKSL